MAWSDNGQNKSVVNNSNNPTDTEATEWKTYSNSQFGFRLSYPPSGDLFIDTGKWQARINKSWRFYFVIQKDIYRIIEMKAHPK